MNPSPLFRRIGIVFVLTLASIAIHEFGHFAIYQSAGYPVHVTLQSVRPIGKVDARVEVLALGGGPALSMIAAAMFLVIAGRRPTLFWVTAALTNASLRVFPCVMDLIRAVRNAHPFSDEGDVVLAFTTTAAGRAMAVVVFLAAYVALTVVTARRYRFGKYTALKAVACIHWVWPWASPWPWSMSWCANRRVIGVGPSGRIRAITESSWRRATRPAEEESIDLLGT